MPPSGCYLFLANIVDSDHVIVETRDPNGRRLNTLPGALKYTTNQAQIADLDKKARKAAQQGKLALPEFRLLGELLFDSLLEPTLQTFLVSLLEKAAKDHTFLRFDILVNETHPILQEMSALPWEFLRATGLAHQANIDWLGTQNNLVLTRQLRLPYTPEPVQLQPNEALRVVLAISAPASAYKDENGHLRPALGPVYSEGVQTILNQLSQANAAGKTPLQLVQTVFPATRPALIEALSAPQPPHIIHFIGHGRLHKTKSGLEVAQIALSDPDLPNLPDWKDAASFSEIFDGKPLPSIVVMEACESAAAPEKQAFESVASQLSRKRIPAVIAMQYEASNTSATAFASQFYASLANGSPVEQAVQDGRREITTQAKEYKGPDFATPVLYMSVESGVLFRLPQPELAHLPPMPAAKEYEALSKLDYILPIGDFLQQAPRRVSAVLISGPEDSEPRWLVNRLARINPPALLSGNRPLAPALHYSFSQYASSYNIENIWQDLSYQINFPAATVSQPALIDYLVSNVWGKQHVCIFLDDVPSILVPDLLKDFWLPLKQAADKKGCQDCCLYLFINTQDSLSPQVSSALDALWDGYPPILLTLPEKIEQAEVLKWLRQVKSSLPKISGWNEAQLAQLSQDAVKAGPEPRRVLDQLCRSLCGFKYDVGASKWLML